MSNVIVFLWTSLIVLVKRLDTMCLGNAESIRLLPMPLSL